MKFSVIIPAYNEAQIIEQTIKALSNQTVSRSEYEIILVDNNSTDDTSGVALTSGCNKIIKELIPGTNIARQRGVKESVGDIIAFLDADCVPPPNWLEKIDVLLSKKGVAAVSGPYNFQFRGLARIGEIIYTHYFFSIVDKLLWFIFRDRAGVIMGGNFATYRATIEKIGGLPPFRFHGDDSAIAMLISRNVGKVLFHRKFNVISASRRFEKEGIFRLTIKYSLYYLISYFSSEEELRKGSQIDS